MTTARRSTDDAVALPSTTSRGRAPGKVLARVVLTLILLFNGAWIAGFWEVNRDLGMPRTQADLMRHVQRIETLLGAADLLAPTNLDALQNELQAATADLQQLDSLLPLGGEWPFGTVHTEHHLLSLAMDTTQTAQNIISAVPILQPQLTRIEYSLMHAGNGRGAAAYGDPLSIQTINNGQHYIDTALHFWQLATQEREQLSVSSVAAMHSTEASTFLHQYDTLAPRLTTGLQLTSSLLDWSPAAAGVRAPDHFLLLVVNPSDLRPGGGRVWDYADLVTQNGALVSGVQLRSVQSLDCPQAGCGERPIPETYAWFPLNNNEFGLADADLDPDLPSAVSTIETMYELETGERVDGVITITPAVYANLLHITGPLSLPGTNAVATSANVEQLLTAEHETVSAAASTQRGVGPDVEVLLTEAILAKLASSDASAGVQGQVGAALYAATQTKDISLFSNSPRVEELLAQLGMARSLSTRASDSLLVSDTNDGLSAVNPFVSEHATDQVTLDAKGTAQHQLTLTYTYSVAAAPAALSPLQPYQDFIRVIVPGSASLPHITGPCEPEQAAEKNHSTAACQLTLAPAAIAVIHATWTAPVVSVHNGAQYSLLVQRQAGAQVAVSVRIAAPSGYTFSHPAASTGTAPNGDSIVLTWSASPLTRDTLLSASLVPSGAGSDG